MNIRAGEVHQACGNCQIRHRAVCSQCSTDELAELDQLKYYRSFAAGQPIAWAGETMDFLGSVVSGVACLTQTMEDGRRQMVGLLQPSDFFGRPGRTKASFDLVAVNDVLMCCFHRKQFEKLLVTTPSISKRLLEMTLDELDAAREWMLLLGRKTAREKIASLLHIFARRTVMLTGSAFGGPVSFVLPLTREAMADYLGLTIETVSRQITVLRKAGVIVLDGNRTVIVPDLDQLAEEAGDDSDGGSVS